MPKAGKPGRAGKRILFERLKPAGLDALGGPKELRTTAGDSGDGGFDGLVEAMERMIGLIEFAGPTGAGGDKDDGNGVAVI